MGAFALNHRTPSELGTRRTVAHGYTCGCSNDPAGVPGTFARIHA
jgi:hypothetical protein